ncbi:MAG: trypsin-like serine peptidase, partial [Actinomycetes bacterium]
MISGNHLGGDVLIRSPLSHALDALRVATARWVTPKPTLGALSTLIADAWLASAGPAVRTKRLQLHRIELSAPGGGRPGHWELVVWTDLWGRQVLVNLYPTEQPGGLTTVDQVPSPASLAEGQRASVQIRARRANSAIGYGSGVVVGPGLVMTAAHVVSGDGAITVREYDEDGVDFTRFPVHRVVRLHWWNFLGRPTLAWTILWSLRRNHPMGLFDVAVLYAPGVADRGLRVSATRPTAGTRAIVPGFPHMLATTIAGRVVGYRGGELHVQMPSSGGMSGAPAIVGRQIVGLAIRGSGASSRSFVTETLAFIDAWVLREVHRKAIHKIG